MMKPNEYRILPVPNTLAREGAEPFKTVFGLTVNQSFRSQKNPASKWSLKDLASDLILIGIRIGSHMDIGEPESLKKLLLNFLSSYEKQCFTAGYGRDQISDSLFALTAWLDECVMNREGNLNEFWSTEPLTVKFFNNSLAGETFFVTLEELIKDPVENVSVLEIYYLCLEFGFEGRYKIGDDKTLRQLRRNLWKQIESTTARPGKVFSVSAGILPGKASSEMDSKKWPLVCLVLLGFSFLMYSALFFLASFEINAVSAVLENIKLIFYQKVN